MISTSESRNRFSQSSSGTPPPGYSAVTLAQAEAFDKEVFRKLAFECRNGLGPKPDGSLPADEHVRAILNEPRVAMLLAPLPAPASSGSQSKRPRSESPRDSGPSRRQRKRQRQAEGRSQRPSWDEDYSVDNLRPKAGKAKGKNKGGRPEKGAGKGARMPQELMGMRSTSRAGVPICYGFNMGSCQAAAAGQRCHRGLHICCKPNCSSGPGGAEGHHPQRECPN